MGFEQKKLLIIFHVFNLAAVFRMDCRGLREVKLKTIKTTRQEIIVG